ncbi:MAG: alanine--glyoxylate aminotransferase family protein [Candidatus Omnitrophica bacterium]|nr:alanine--glyoxylate aminotransferase family protein [Candidatus Omnitrophota bacterium]
MHKDYLLTPGPTPLPPQVQEALSRPIIHHRTNQYRALFKRALQGMQAAMQTSQPVVMFTSSGTGAMEAAVCNLLSPGDRAVVILGGKFAERWQELCKAFGAQVTAVPVAYGEAVDPEQVRAALARAPEAKAVFGTLCETSTGVVHDVKAVASIVRPTQAAFVVDAISGLLCDECPTDEWGIDVVVTGSQKGLMLPPGLAFMSLSQKARGLIDQAKGPRYYFDLRHYQKSLADDDTPFTSSVSLVVALDEALKLILAEGVPQVLQRFRLLAQATRAGCEAMGLSLFAKRPSNGVTAVNVPAAVDGKKLVKQIQDRYHVTLAGGQGEMAGKIFRIAHMGFIGPFDTLTALAAIELALGELGAAVKPGEAWRAAQALLREVFPVAQKPSPATAAASR